jgi:6-pyruvoyltetrahydropterin/6-carboxytetrahydropterin synthase
MAIFLKRRAVFSAAHNYWLEGLTPDENRALFGKWAGERGHGHNYVVEITVGGEPDALTGIVVNMTVVDRILKTNVTSVLDGRFLNQEIAYFRLRPPTLENITKFVWERTAPELPHEVSLECVQVWESETLWASKEQDLSQISLTRAYDFSAAHRLHSQAITDEENREIFGKCNNPNGHGHNYGVEVTLTGEPDERTGMLFALEQLDRIVEEVVLEPFDHKNLNLDVPEFADINPTSEMLAVVIWEKLAPKLPQLSRVVIRETPRNSFEYRGRTDGNH